MTDHDRRLFLVRHGASEANLASPYRLQGGRVDLPLCEEGREQSRAAADALKEASIRWAFSSPLQRAFQTAEIITATHGVGVEEFRECDVGRWEGLSWEKSTSATRNTRPDSNRTQEALRIQMASPSATSSAALCRS